LAPGGGKPVPWTGLGLVVGRIHLLGSTWTSTSVEAERVWHREIGVTGEDIGPQLAPGKLDLLGSLGNPFFFLAISWTGPGSSGGFGGPGSPEGPRVTRGLRFRARGGISFGNCGAPFPAPGKIPGAFHRLGFPGPSGARGTGVPGWARWPGLRVPREPSYPGLGYKLCQAGYEVGGGPLLDPGKPWGLQATRGHTL